ncbi:MerR family transcriptional regulator [Solicola gregarius]|uniref:MerR family transcriptional regulator n=1 Tax=Solicola gregarius TaxID=2908642 RepID=A0AA46YJW7_9ACTN|nr:MerR family transcriptional regulator [Solicola gregarius]UYM04797.1 MerR family transcriptional regulator [Solicola gregarius]
MSNGLLPIGAFSRASMLSIKALRAYHESGLLVPGRVDPHTGYRAYHSAQLIDAAVIYRLRSLDLPLDEVREVLHARDPDVTAKVLAAHEDVMRERLTRVERIVADLQDGIERPQAHTPVFVRDEPHQHTLAVRGRVACDGYAEFLGGAYAMLAEAVAHGAVTPIAETGALYPAEIPSDEPDDVEAFLPIAEPVALGREGVVNAEVPAATVAVLVHAGAYDDIDDSYRKLGAWVADNAEPSGLPVRERYLVSYGDTDDPSRFRTEICWPVITTEEIVT